MESSKIPEPPLMHALPSMHVRQTESPIEKYKRVINFTRDTKKLYNLVKQSNDLLNDFLQQDNQSNHESETEADEAEAETFQAPITDLIKPKTDEKEYIEFLEDYSPSEIVQTFIPPQDNHEIFLQSEDTLSAMSPEYMSEEDMSEEDKEVARITQAFEEDQVVLTQL